MTIISEDKGRVLILNPILGNSATSCFPKEIHGKLLSSMGILGFFVKQLGGLSLYKETRWVKSPFLLLLIPRVPFLAVIPRNDSGSTVL